LNSLKNIAVFTSNRSEYGLLRPLLKKLKSDPDFDLLLLVGGSHLSQDFGFTRTQIVDDGFEIAGEFDFLQPGNSSDYITHSMGVLQIEIGKWFCTNNPDLLIILGDRFELIPVVSSALLNNIPIAHISGGDITEGSLDNQVRHAITKMAHLHFPATRLSGANIRAMGEEEWRICVSGEPGLDEILSFEPFSKEDLFKELRLSHKHPVIVFTFHPETIFNQITGEFIGNLLFEIINKTEYQVLATAANFDNGGAEINRVLEEMSAGDEKIRYVQSLGQKRYYSLLKYSDLVLGNSSSGIVEAQSFHIPAINVGSRQKGRLANKNVVNITADVESILKTIAHVSGTEFKSSIKQNSNLYGDGKASDRIIDFISSVDAGRLLVKKSVFKHQP
jgi:GDP/UDP-N,N'-diacetylbacillosamine 2-epimerase (hydrolysing)